MSYQAKVNIGVLIFILWMVVQAIRSPLWGEPYPAIRYPGFSYNGKTPILTYELSKIEGKNQYPITHYDTRYGHTQFKRILMGILDALRNDNQIEYNRLIKGIINIKGLQKGDTLVVVERKWKANRKGYAAKEFDSKQIVL